MRFHIMIPIPAITKQTIKGYITNFLLSGSIDGRIVLLMVSHELQQDFFAGDNDSCKPCHKYKFTED